jgi:FkbM family methyltransferase
MMKFLNPKNYFRFLKNRLIKYRIRYGSPMRIVSNALGENIAFIVSSEKEYFMRAKLSYISEQTTMNWIETQIKQNDVVFDIGANVGAYSLLIGKKLVGGGSVLAFEPESSNFYSLNRNIVANDLSGTVTALCMGFDTDLKVEKFFLSSTVPGSATHSVGKAESEMIKFKPEHVQGILTFSLDQFVEMDRVPFPNHIKIDVDGNEGLIIDHSSKTLSDSRLKSLVIEISENVSLGKIEKTIESHGFQIFEKEEWKTDKHGTVKNILYVKNS